MPPPDDRDRISLLELPIGLASDGRPPVSKRTVLYLLGLLFLIAVAVGWITTP